MRRWMLALVIVLLLFAPRAALAQSPVEIDRLELDLWPEYDRPDLLVIYRVTLSASTNLPASLSLRIPAEAGRPANLAAKDLDGLLYNLTYTTETEGKWVRVNFTTASQEIQLEFYDPRIQKNGNQRSLEFLWPADYTVDSFSLLVQQPTTATNFKVLPDMGAGRPGQDGLNYYSSVIGRVEAGTETVNIKISYQKDNDTLSANPEAVQPSQPLTNQTVGRTTMQEMLPWLLGGLGLILIAGGAVWYWQSGRVASAQPAYRRHGKRQAAEEDGPVFCHECGKRASPGDVFCRVCGSRLRS